METIYFNSKSDLYKELSNFYESEFTIDGKVWKTVEHYFQHEKFPEDIDLQAKIYSAKTPAIAKRLGQTQSPHFRSDWIDKRNEIMEKAIRAKFSQHPDLVKKLKSTGNAWLVEKSTVDDYWGCGRSGCGLNKMGHILMKLRNEL